MVFDHAFDRVPQKYKLPICKQGGLPQPAHSAVAVLERMNEFKFIVKYAGLDKHIYFAFFKPRKKLIGKWTHHIVRWSDMNNFAFLIINTYLCGAQLATLSDKPVHHDLVYSQQVFGAIWVDTVDLIVWVKRISDRTDVFFGSQNPITVEYLRYLLHSQSVIFYRKRRMHRLNVRRTAKSRQSLKIVYTVKPAELSIICAVKSSISSVRSYGGIYLSILFLLNFYYTPHLSQGQFDIYYYLAYYLN